MKTLLKNASRLPFAPIMAVLFGLVAAILIVATPGGLLGNLVMKTGLTSLIPSAAPPLGMKAKLMLGSIGFVVFSALAFGVAKMVEGRMKGGQSRRRGFGVDMNKVDEGSQAPVAEEQARRRPIIAGQELGAPFMSDEALAQAPVAAGFEHQAEHDDFGPIEFPQMQTPYTASPEPMPISMAEPAPVTDPFASVYNNTAHADEAPLTLDLNNLADDLPFSRPVEMPVHSDPEAPVAPVQFNPYADQVEDHQYVSAANYEPHDQSAEDEFNARQGQVFEPQFEPAPEPIAVAGHNVHSFEAEREMQNVTSEAFAEAQEQDEKISISELVSRFEQGMAQLSRLTQEERDHAAAQAQAHVHQNQGTPIALHEALGRLERLAGGQRA